MMVVWVNHPLRGNNALFKNYRSSTPVPSGDQAYFSFTRDISETIKFKLNSDKHRVFSLRFRPNYTS